MNRSGALKIILWAIAVYHFFIGGIAFLSPDAAVPLAQMFFGMHIDASPQLLYMAKILGMYAAIFGAFTAGAAMDLEKSGFVLKVIVALYALRVLNRLFFFQQIHDLFGVTPERNVVETVLLAFFGLSVFLLAPKKPASAGGNTHMVADS